MSRYRFARVIALCSLLGGMGRAHAAEKLRFERIDLTKTPTFKTYLTLVDSDGRVVTGRATNQFKLVVDGAEQGTATSMTTFDQSKEPTHVVIVASVSAAMSDALDDIKRGVRALASAVEPTKSKMALLGYSAETKRVVDFGSPAEVDSGASQLAIDSEGAEPHLLDAVHTAIDLLRALPKTQRRMIVLFSDGVNVNMDRKAFVAVGKKAADEGIIINSIGYAAFDASSLRNLAELSKQSNGTERSCKSTHEISEQFLNIVDEINKQYIVTFDTAFGGGDLPTHGIQVIAESAGHQAYSGIINQKIPKATHPFNRPNGQVSSTAWWVWGLGGLGIMVLVLVITWLIVRPREEMPEVEATPQPVVSTAAPQKTMAINAVGGDRALTLGWIVATNGKCADKTFKLKPMRTLIGTDSDCDVVVEDQFMSSHHCEVRFENGNYKLCDLGSTNGIVVNDKKVREHELVDNDLFRLGRTEFKFKSIS